MINLFENVNGHRNETTCAYALTNIHPMENHPFKVKDDEDMAALVESIEGAFATLLETKPIRILPPSKKLPNHHLPPQERDKGDPALIRAYL